MYNLLLYSLFTGVKSLAQKTTKHVQKVRGIKEKGMYHGSVLGAGEQPLH